MWRLTLRVGFVALFSSVTHHANAMTFHAAPPLLYAGGPVVASDWAAWEEAMTRFDGKIDTVVFHESGGGDSVTGRRIGSDIRKRGLKTVALGRCSSACANMFLGGTIRQFASRVNDVNTTVGFHGSYSKETKSLNRNRRGDYFVNMTGGKMSEDFVERFILIEDKRGMMRFAHPLQRDQPSDPVAMLCKGNELPSQRNEQCEKLGGVSALSKGVVTTWDTRDVKPPPKPAFARATFKTWDSAPAAASAAPDATTQSASAASSRP
jgi:hypothetical protein